MLGFQGADLAVEDVEQRIEARRNVPLALEALHVKLLDQGAVGGHWVRAIVLPGNGYVSASQPR